jgi:hypothetical protein
MNRMNRPDDHFIELIKRSGSADKVIALEAQHELATALEQPLRKGVLVGDVLDGIFERLSMEPGTSVEFPLDLLAPGTENEHVAYTNPGHGRIPERAVEGDYVMVPTYTVASSIDYLLRYAREARWDVVGRAMQVLEAGFVKKMNDDGWHTLLAAGVDRNILVYDGDAADGQFTKRVISLMKTVMRRNAGGNTGSLNRGKMTDLYLSPEALEDIRNWGVDQVDETTRREIYQAGDDASAITRIFGVNLHDMDEMGENQEYQKFFSNQLAASLNGTDPELVVGIDRTANDSFIMPIKQDVQIFEDDALHRHQRAGFYGWAEVGFAVLDNRRILLGSF